MHYQCKEILHYLKYGNFADICNSYIKS